MLSLIVSIIALGLIIAFHELGHFTAAKAFKVGVIEFCLGFGPKLISHRGKNTDYALRLLPIGGACVMLGEDEEYEESPGGAPVSEDGSSAGTGFPEDKITVNGRTYPAKQQFSAKPPWQRFIIVAAGPLFNFILVFLIALVITAAYGYDRNDILAVDEGYPMAEAGVEEGDSITGLGVVGDGRDHVRISRIETARDIELFLMEHADALDDQELIAVRFRDESEGGTEKTAVIRTIYDEEAGSYRLGFTYSYAYLKAVSPGEIIYYAFYDVKYCIRSVISSIRMLISGSVGAGDIMGPVRMVAVMDETVDQASDYGLIAALMSLMELMMLISGCVGAMNLLPVPALDGGRLLFIIIEIIMRRPVPKNLEGRVHFVGFILLFALMIFVLFNDAVMLIFS